MWLRRITFVAALVAAAPADVGARSEKVVGWTQDRVFPTAVRFLRVNEKATILEKDAETGYVLFELPDDGKLYRGALELVVTTDDPPKLRLVLQIEDRPDYMEVGMLDRLERKLRDELGAPPTIERPKKKKPDKKPEPEKPADPPAQ
jgi:hypothetical protein